MSNFGGRVEASEFQLKGRMELLPSSHSLWAFEDMDIILAFGTTERAEVMVLVTPVLQFLSRSQKSSREF
eukprot:CAMPEP_0170275034 /NCGR_PEP_ID=MMETSP0116_2-20130129/37492_1 /TAXON_ID=400756 /ORGANISM="Durinskia baltica, Strain CSIRO CS-38" /LENGTH=69 /DNA_ID=CAMNT_0010526287 /DNA_START=661 /DNA_END=870 /DNA_ORIENTATION=-